MIELQQANVLNVTVLCFGLFNFCLELFQEVERLVCPVTERLAVQYPWRCPWAIAPKAQLREWVSLSVWENEKQIVKHFG